MSHNCRKPQPTSRQPLHGAAPLRSSFCRWPASACACARGQQVQSDDGAAARPRPWMLPWMLEGRARASGAMACLWGACCLLWPAGRKSCALPFAPRLLPRPPPRLVRPVAHYATTAVRASGGGRAMLCGKAHGAHVQHAWRQRSHSCNCTAHAQCSTAGGSAAAAAIALPTPNARTPRMQRTSACPHPC